MNSLERCRILLGISENNTKKLAILEVCLDKARDDISEFCRDTFYDESGADVFPRALRSVQEDLAVIKYRKRGRREKPPTLSVMRMYLLMILYLIM